MDKEYSYLFSIAYTVYSDDPEAENLTREQHVSAMLRRVADINEADTWREAMGAPLETNDDGSNAAHVAAELPASLVETRIAEKNNRIEMLERDLQEREQRLKDYGQAIDELRKAAVLQKNEIERLNALREAQRRLDDRMDADKQAKPTG